MKKQNHTMWLEVTVGPLWLVLAGAWAVSAALSSMQAII
jgi:hypothetical protein